MIDTHAHLNFKAFDKDVDEVIERAKKRGVEKFIIPGAKLSSSKRAVFISERFPECYAAVGIHPHHVDTLDTIKEEEIISSLENLLSSQKTIAVGEIGLDKHHYTGYPAVDEEILKKQIKLLRIQLSLAQKHNLPIILHCRDAYPELVHFLKHFREKEGNLPKGVVHSFEGTGEDLKNFLGLSFYISFNGLITKKNLDTIIKKTPLHRILIETDSPFLTPVGAATKRNEPQNIELVYQKVSALKKITKEQLMSIVRKNVAYLFGI